MFGIGGFNPVSLLATAAFGPAGGIVAQLATQVFSQFGQQLLQNLGQQAGLPQSQIEWAQADFTSRFGDIPATSKNVSELIDAFGAETNASPTQIAEAQRQTQDMQNMLRDVVSQMSESQEFKDAKASRGKGGGGTGAPGWMMAMAKFLGEKLDAMAHDMERRAANISEKDPSSSAEFGVVSQQFGMLMNATNNAIKTIGEALAGMAKRQ